MSKKQVFTDIKLLIGCYAKYINTVEMWNNQVDVDSNERRELPFAFPAAFVSFEQIDWQPGNNKKEQRTASFIIGIRVVVEDYLWNTAEYFKIVDAVNYALHGRSTTHTTYLQRVEEIQDVDHDNCVVWQINYLCSYMEEINPPAGETDGTSQVTLTIDDIEINKDLDIDNPVVRTGDGTF
jgi:hypothetical protein